VVTPMCLEEIVDEGGVRPESTDSASLINLGDLTNAVNGVPKLSRTLCTNAFISSRHIGVTTSFFISENAVFIGKKKIPHRISKTLLGRN